MVWNSVTGAIRSVSSFGAIHGILIYAILRSVYLKYYLLVGIRCCNVFVNEFTIFIQILLVFFTANADFFVVLLLFRLVFTSTIPFLLLWSFVVQLFSSLRRFMPRFV